MIDVATEMFAITGYEATSLRQIAAGSEIDIATLKYHYKDKPTLFSEVYRRGHNAFLDAIEPVLTGLDEVDSKEGLVVLLDDLVDRAHDFVERQHPFHATDDLPFAGRVRKTSSAWKKSFRRSRCRALARSSIGWWRKRLSARLIPARLWRFC